MGLIDDIRTLVEAGKLPRIWTVQDLAQSELVHTHTRVNMQSQPTNRSVSPDLQDKGAGVSEPESAPFFRFKPGGKRGMYFCLKSHYVAGRDPSTLLEPFTFDPAQEFFTGHPARVIPPIERGAIAIRSDSSPTKHPMAFKVAPSSREKYLEKISPFLDWLVVEVAGPDGQGWSRALESYTWGDDHLKALALRERFHDRLKAALATGDESALRRAVGAILSWGGMKPLSEAHWGEVRGTLIYLDRLPDDEEPAKTAIFGQRMASVSKLYAMLDLDRWTIYDSRVGLAWARWVKKYRQQSPGNTLEGAVDWPIPPGKGKAFKPLLPPGWPLTGGNPAGARDAFLHVSWAFRDIAKRLDARVATSGGWRTVHVEMVAFMLGVSPTW